MKNYKDLAKKINELKKGNKYDLSMEEDLSIAVMNLISLEEHFFFTSQKTKKTKYLDLLVETREIRKELLSKLIDKHEGETWCISKHLLATTMRLMEVGTKLQASGKNKEAKEAFEQAYKVYSLFWGVRLDLLDLSELKSKEKSNKLMTHDDILNDLVDCCKE